ncbi:extracellular solute-binding protein [Paenibacillus sp. HB172176]|uniref:extracellular solute-binding protein n=1 Tax=Paenibacillus sp. HB172176 TaxID=2493690 RepID=UPI00143893C3|nr:extracellular solute-binding protein [Paenibacillus sp. HB172176]
MLTSKGKWRKTSSMLLVLAMALSVTAGCSQNGSNNEKGSTPSSTNGQESANPQETAKSEEPFKLSVMAMTASAETPKDDNEILNALEEATGTQLDFTWVPKAQIDEKTNLMLASGDLPQLMYIQSLKSPSIISAAESGAFWDVEPYLGDYPNLSQENPSIVNNIRIDGKQYGIYKYSNLAQVGVIYRKDWLNNVGMEEPKTPDEFYEMLKAFKTEDPDKNGKDDTYGMVYYKESFLSFFRIIALWFGSPNIWGEDKDGNLVPDFMTDGYMEGLKFMKRLYDEKLMNQDFAVVDSGKGNELFITGVAGANFGSVGNANAWQTNEKITAQNGEVDMFSTLDGGFGPRARASGGYLGVYMIPKKTVKTEDELRKVLQFLDKLNEQKAQDLLEYGIEGKHYQLENGEVKVLDKEQLLKDRLDLNQLQLKTVNHLTPKQNSDFGKKMEALVQANEKVAVVNLAEAFISDTYSKQGQQLDNMRYDMMVKFVMGQIDEAGYKAEIDKWLQAGGSAVIQELNDQYQKFKKQ